MARLSPLEARFLLFGVLNFLKLDLTGEELGMTLDHEA